MEPPVSTQRKEGVTGFTFPLTPLANRIYSEEDDMEMDVWLQIDLDNAMVESKSLTLVVTPFKKTCASRDLLYRQCRYKSVFGVCGSTTCRYPILQLTSSDSA